MMMRTLSLFLVAIGVCPALPAAPQTADAPMVSIELRRLTQELLDALAPGNTAVWQRSLHDRCVHMDENGVVRGKAALIEEIKPLPAGLTGRIEIDTFTATLHGNTAVTTYELQEYLDYHGQQLRTRFRAVDTWLSTGEGWRLIGEHVAAVLKDPPAMAMTAQQLREYEGSYSLTPEIRTTIRAADGALTSERTGRPAASYRPEVRDVFFAPGQPRTRRIFTRDAQGQVDGFVDRREGEDVRWTREKSS